MGIRGSINANDKYHTVQGFWLGGSVMSASEWYNKTVWQFVMWSGGMIRLWLSDCKWANTRIYCRCKGKPRSRFSTGSLSLILFTLPLHNLSLTSDCLHNSQQSGCPYFSKSWTGRSCSRIFSSCRHYCCKLVTFHSTSKGRLLFQALFVLYIQLDHQRFRHDNRLLACVLNTLCWIRGMMNSLGVRISKYFLLRWVATLQHWLYGIHFVYILKKCIAISYIIYINILYIIIITFAHNSRPCLRRDSAWSDQSLGILIRQVLALSVSKHGWFLL